MTAISETPRSIRREIITLLVITLSSVLILSGFIQLNYERNRLVSEQTQSALIRVEELSHAVVARLHHGEMARMDELDELLSREMRKEELTAILFTGTNGAIIAGKMRIPGEGQPIVSIRNPADIPDTAQRNHLSRPVSSGTDHLGTVELFLNDAVIDRKLRTVLIEQFAHAFTPIAIVCIVLYVGLFKLLLSPLSEVLRMAREFGQGNLGARVTVDSENEIATLAQTFNRMAERVEEKIAQHTSAEKKYRFLFEAIQDVFYREDREGFVQLASPSVEKVLGYASSEMVGRNFADLCVISGAREVLAAEVLSRGFVEDYDLLLRHKDGHVVPVSVNSHLYHAEDGTVMGIEGTLRDITDRAQAFEEISFLKSSFADIIETLPSAIIVVDAEQRVELMNRHAQDFSGFLVSQAKGVPVVDVLPHLEPLLRDIPEIAFRKEPFSKEKIKIEHGSETRFFDLQIYPLLSNDASRAVIRFEDVTDKVRIQEALIQSEKMLMVGGLAAGTAHEINNPLAAILQNAQNIERRISPDIPANLQAAGEVGTDLASVRAYLEKRGITGFVASIREGGARASKIIANMLQFSRKTETVKEMSNLNLVVEQSLELAASDYDLRKRYDFKRVGLERDFDPNIPLVSLTVSEIEQVILNIIKNAAQALWESGRPEPRITLRTRCTDDFAVIEIEDNGPGMPEIVRRRVFEPFFTTREVGSGTGLGMSVSYTIITSNHNGQIDVWSEPGKGARFTISLPLAKGPA